MTREIIVNASPEETRIAVLEGGRAAEILIERDRDDVLAGHVYLGRVDRLVPGMQSAFIDIGLERHAFLHVTEVLSEDGGADAVPGDAADGEPAEAGAEDAYRRRRRAADRRIEDLLREGQELLVQVTREPMGRKGARVTAHVTLPGRYLVLMPFSSHVGISKRVVDDAARERLGAEVEAIRQEHPGGYIVRTNAADQDAEVLRADAAALQARWRDLQARAAAASAPAAVEGELPLALRIVRDAVAAETARVVVDDEDTHAAVLAFARRQSPDLAPLVHHYTGATPLFEAFGLEHEIEKALRDRAWLKSGGYLVINQLEALVAIDVNTGKYTGGRGLEDTALRTNLEAAAEVARQLRLRDLGGIVIIDFIDLVDAAHRQAVLDALQRALAADRARTSMLGMSEFGLVEVTRQRQRNSLQRALTDPCSGCGGTGRVRSLAAVVADALRRARRAISEAPGREIRLICHPEVAAAVRARVAAADSSGPSLGSLTVVEEHGRRRETFDLVS